MTFPDNYVIVGPRRSIQRQLGNAVAPEVAKVVMTSLMKQLGHLDASNEPDQSQLALV